jgi:hypothetical protein
MTEVLDSFALLPNAPSEVIQQEQRLILDLENELMDVATDEWKYEFEFERIFPDALRRELASDPLLFESSDEESEICKFFLKGTCMKGDDCPYKHSRGEKAVVCKHWYGTNKSRDSTTMELLIGIIVCV